MRFECNSCHAKYKISDEKVVGQFSHSVEHLLDRVLLVEGADYDGDWERLAQRFESVGSCKGSSRGSDELNLFRILYTMWVFRLLLECFRPEYRRADLSVDGRGHP